MKRFTRGANAHLSDDEAVAKMGHPALWVKGWRGCGGAELIGVLPLRKLRARMTATTDDCCADVVESVDIGYGSLVGGILLLMESGLMVS